MALKGEKELEALKQLSIIRTASNPDFQRLCVIFEDMISDHAQLSHSLGQTQHEAEQLHDELDTLNRMYDQLNKENVKLEAENRECRKLLEKVIRMGMSMGLIPEGQQQMDYTASYDRENL